MYHHIMQASLTSWPVGNFQREDNDVSQFISVSCTTARRSLRLRTIYKQWWSWWREYMGIFRGPKFPIYIPVYTLYQIISYPILYFNTALHTSARIYTPSRVYTCTLGMPTWVLNYSPNHLPCTSTRTSRPTHPPTNQPMLHERTTADIAYFTWPTLLMYCHVKSWWTKTYWLNPLVLSLFSVVKCSPRETKRFFHTNTTALIQTWYFNDHYKKKNKLKPHLINVPNHITTTECYTFKIPLKILLQYYYTIFAARNTSAL